MKAALLSIAVAALAWASPAFAARGEWLAGDLHVHTTYSHDSYGGPADDNNGPDEAYTLGHTVTDDFATAASRGLDYMAITDHNDIRPQSDPGFGAFGVLPLHAYENSLHGHAQMLGATRLYDNGDQSTAAVAALEAQLHADGGIFQANHPSDPVWEYGYDVPVDDVEVWNLPRFYQSAAPSTSDNDNATRYWQGWLDGGAHVTATGGSDSHWRATDAQQGPGNPTTWVYSNHHSTAGVLDGLRRGRTFITWQPPAFHAPKLFLEAGDRMVGDTVPAKSTVRRAAAGARG